MASMKLQSTIAMLMMLTIMLIVSPSYAADGDSCSDLCSGYSCDMCDGEPNYNDCCINSCCPPFPPSSNRPNNFLRI
uniref:Transmembrane protein n=1 Tax=Solanum lycopersicum TaxID=4081 RepID=A0A3Q7FDY8_SOLLC